MADTDLSKTILAAQLRAIEPTEDDLQEVKASLGLLQGLLPPGINPEEEPDLLFVVANVAVAGLVNLNDDGLDIPTALKVYKKFEKKFVDIEHDRSKIRGYILHAGLSEFGTDRVITEEEARSANQPFNISTVAVLWKKVDPNLCKYILEATNPVHPDYAKISLSFEMGFLSCYLITLPLGEKEIAKATKIIRREDPDFKRYLTSLRANKGTGFSPDDDTQRLYRIMPEDVLPLGEGIVAVPAAQVKGIEVISESPEKTIITTAENVPVDSVIEADETDEHDMASITAAKASFNEFYNKLLKNRVSANIPELNPISLKKTMKHADLQKVKEQAAAATKIEDLQVAFANAAQLAEILNTESERIVKDLETQKALNIELEKAKQEAVAARAQLATEVAEVKKQLGEIKAAQEATAAEEKFHARMATLDEVFDLEKEERALLVDEVRASTDEAFAKFVEKQKVLMKDKTKACKAAKKAADKTKADELCASLIAKGVKITAGDSIDFAEILASATRTDATLPNEIDKGKPSLKEQYAEAFADVEIGGVKVSELAKK